MRWLSPLCLLAFLCPRAYAQPAMTTPNGWAYEVLRPGSGPELNAHSGALTHNQLADGSGKVLVSTYQIGVPDYQLMSDLSPAFQQAFSVMQPGGKYRFFIPMEDFREAMRSQASLSLSGPRVIWDMELLEVLPPKPDGARLVAQAVRQDGPDEAYKLYESLLRNGSAYFGEWEANQVGYLFLQQGRTDESIRIFSDNVRNYPRSANAHDSLAEAYLKAGDSSQAAEHYRKSLDLNPRNENARAMLAKLKE